ncbi:MAG: ABC transporter substrate-binding protein [Acidobacteria bacterium]|nr:ABC transporter substrate-binding protein [Acidobacteriota bacterium]
MSSADSTKLIQIAHSPDSDDAFMFYGLATSKVRVPGFKFVHTLTDIETLNQRAIHDPFYDVSAISFHAYPYVQDEYALMDCGGSVGEGYGPIVIAQKPFTHDELKKIRVAIPGELTTAYLTLKLFAPEIETEMVPFTEIIPAVVSGQFEAGLLIHEGQLTYTAQGLKKVLDVGTWWREQTGLPLPLGANVVRRSLGRETMEIVTKAVRDSIQHGLDHREEALAYAMQFARDLDPNLANHYVGMYVNERTISFGEDGREAIRRLFEMGYERGVIPHRANLDIVGV